jgi:hypothetical protein
MLNVDINKNPKNIFFISFSLFNKKAHTKCMGYTPILNPN